MDPSKNKSYIKGTKEVLIAPITNKNVSVVTEAMMKNIMIPINQIICYLLFFTFC